MSNRTLVIGTAMGMNVAQIWPFVESLRVHYDGEAALVISSRGTEAVVKYLASRDVKPVFYDSVPWMFLQVQTSRYARYAEVLREELSDPYERVFFTDVTDVLFQANPFEFAPAGKIVCFLEDSRATIGRCRSNSLWVKQVYGDAILQGLFDRRISCSGTTMGDHAALIDYCDKILAEARPDIMIKLVGVRGHDQGIHNYLLNTGKLPGAVVNENGDFVFTLAQVPDGEVMVKVDGIYTLADKRCPIVHQWTYKKHAAAWVRAKYPVPAEHTPPPAPVAAAPFSGAQKPVTFQVIR